MELRVTTASTLVVVLFVMLDVSSCLAEKLSPGQKAPAFAKGSGGLALKAPYEAGSRAADVGQKRAQINPAPPAAPSSGSAQVDGVIREETEELKEVDGQLVRVVKGNFAYDSPEGLPISVKYVADENGNRASFTFGTGKPSGGGSRPSGGGNKPALTPGGPGATSQGVGGTPGSGGTGNGRPAGANGGGKRPGGGSGPSTYLPPTTKVDRSYLPPN